MLGGDTILFPPEALDKKEDIKDVIGYLENWADMVIVRHKDLSLIEYMAEHSHIPIINAMTDVNHPCEILTDLYSLSKKYVDYSEKECLFMGSKGNIGNTWKEASELVGLILHSVVLEDMKLTELVSAMKLTKLLLAKILFAQIQSHQRRRTTLKVIKSH